MSHSVTKVRRAASHIEDSCLSVGSHSAAAFTVVFDHSGMSLLRSILLYSVKYLRKGLWTEFKAYGPNARCNAKSKPDDCVAKFAPSKDVI